MPLSISFSRHEFAFFLFFARVDTRKQPDVDGRWLLQYRAGARYGMVLSETLPFAAYVLDVCSLTSYALWIHSHEPPELHIAHTDY